MLLQHPREGNMRIILLSLVLIFFGHGAAGAEELLAPVFPDAIKFDESQVGLKAPRVLGGFAAERQVFLAKESPQEVVAFYAERLGPLEESGQDKPERGRSFVRILMPAAETGRRAPSMVLARDAGIEVLQRAPRDRDHYFWQLRDSVLRGLHTAAEFEAVASRYRWLETAFFPHIDDGSGQLKPADKVITDRFAAARKAQLSAPTGDMQTVGREIQELMAAGRYEEASKRMEDMQQAMGGLQSVVETDPWQEGLDYLTELEKQAYRAAIIIDRDPALWP